LLPIVALVYAAKEALQANTGDIAAAVVTAIFILYWLSLKFSYALLAFSIVSSFSLRSFLIPSTSSGVSCSSRSLRILFLIL